MKTSIALAFIASVWACQSAMAQTRFATLYTFMNGSPGQLISTGGALYGVYDGLAPTGSDCGGVFELQPPSAAGGGWTETVLYSFAESGDACVPIGLVPGVGGAFYGVTELGGAFGYGAIFELRPPASPGGTWTESILYNLSFGNSVNANLVPGPAGSLYALGNNEIDQLQPPPQPSGTWIWTVLYRFGATGAANSLTAGPHGVLYGTIATGVASGGQLGQVFQLTPPASPGGAWTETALHNFGYGGHDAGNPNSLTVASDGALYGTTYGYDLSGDAGRGSVFQLTPPASPGGAWSYAVLQDFNGYHVNPGLILRNGNLYGGLVAPDGGHIFQMQPPSTPEGAWTTTFLHEWTNGQGPYVELMDKNGVLYGTTQTFEPGLPFYGTIFALTTN